MFRGGFAHNFDDKGRIIIPLKFRSLLGEKFVITKGLDRCLWVFTEEGFRELDKRIKSRPMLDLDAVRLQRFFSGEAVDTQVDSQGRVAIPASLREYAGIGKEAMIIGAGERLEIWCKGRWDSLSNDLTDEMISQAARQMGIG
ncbi:MAG TPA: division/cell wall cluster transcriptional repressor MraZ [Armatimonadota bacterium]|jgi:MraZ protein